MKNLYVEIANTPIKRECGLMGVKKLPKNSGMMFDFPNKSHQSFWMSNTYVPLNIAFVEDDGTIFQIEEMVPLSTRAIRSKKPCRYALEVNKGWFKENDVSVGSRIGGLIFTDPFKQNKIKEAQMMDAPVMGDMPVEGLDSANPFGDPNAPVEEPVEPDPDVMINKDRRQQIHEYMDQYPGPDLLIIYETKGGVRLPPKTISPPYTLEDDADGSSDSVLKAWDTQTAGWKSFLVDNIISMEEMTEESRI